MTTSPKSTREEQTLSLKLEVLAHYCPNGDPCCACCGEEWPIFLGIDHMNGQGAAHRKQIGRGAVLHRWLKTQGYPKGFQVLCFNCNFAKHRKGTCPHQGTPHEKNHNNGGRSFR
jgi:hypothetical protein